MAAHGSLRPWLPGPLRFQRGMPAAPGAANRGAADDAAAEHRELRGIHGVVSMHPEGRDGMIGAMW